MSKETISMEEQDLIKACQTLATNRTLTVPGLLNILDKVPRLVESLATRLEAQYDKTETLRMQVQDLRQQLETRDNAIAHMEENAASELRGNMVLRDEFGAKPDETFPEFVTRLHQERIVARAELLRLSSDLTLTTERTQVGGPSHQTLLDEIAKTGELLNKETNENARLVSNLTEAEIKIAEQARTLEHMDLRHRQMLSRVDNLESILAVASHRASVAEQALQVNVIAGNNASAEANRLRVELQNMEMSRLAHGLTISDTVVEAYQTAKDKGWHDPADEDDVTVVETRQALCEEGMRALHLCRIAEMLRKGKKPEVGDYMRLFGGHTYLLTAADTRLISDLMLVITEVGEAIEDVVFGRLEEKVDEKGKPVGLPTELADVVIRVAHICGHRKIDLAGAIQRKLKFNKTRPRKHGKHA